MSGGRICLIWVIQLWWHETRNKVALSCHYQQDLHGTTVWVIEGMKALKWDNSSSSSSRNDLLSKI